jgi:DNA invertase Pin-like site-specific DNA recombinase
MSHGKQRPDILSRFLYHVYLIGYFSIMDEYTKTIDVKVWLIRSGYTQNRIAKDLKISRQTVWKTIHGKHRNRRVLQWLQDHLYPQNLI